MLPVLPATATGGLPAEDRERLATFDRQIAMLVEAIRERGFSELTVRSIFAARERLYSERGAVWKRLVLHGQPLVSVERFGDDEQAARAWVRDRLGDAVRSKVADTVRTGRQERYRPVPYFEAWLGDRDLTDESSGEVVVRAYVQYAAWLDRQGDVVVSEADALLARNPQDGLTGSVVRAAREAASAFRTVAFQQFDDLFGTHLVSGLEQIRAGTPIPPPPTDRRGLFRRLVDRLLDEAPTTIEDRKGLEYRALSEFFGVASSMSRTIGLLVDTPQVTRIVDEFKRVTGMDAVEAVVLRTADARLDELVNEQTAFAFLAAFDHELPRASSARHEPAGNGRGAGDAGDSSTVGVGPDPVTVVARATGTSVTFTRAALDDGRWAAVLYDKLVEMLGGVMPHHRPTREFVEMLCRASHDLRTHDPDPGKTQLDKRVLRRLALMFHPDVQPTAGRRTDVDDMNAKTLSRLIELHRNGTLEIRAVAQGVTVLTARSS